MELGTKGHATLKWLRGFVTQERPQVHGDPQIFPLLPFLILSVQDLPFWFILDPFLLPT